jgi:hypothetical protein
MQRPRQSGTLQAAEDRMYTRGLCQSFGIGHTLETRDHTSFCGCDTRSTTTLCAFCWCVAETSHPDLLWS